jgi:tellurite resistance protein TerC
MVWLWIAFILFVLLLLALDLGVFHRKAHEVHVKEALGWSAVWITLALLFVIPLYFAYENHWLGVGLSVDALDGSINDGKDAVVKYLTGYVIEKSLSVDNIFVIAMIFGMLGIPAMYQHRVLFWGILGALLMRGLMIGVGAALIARFHWVLYAFGVLLILTALKMLVLKSHHTDPRESVILNWTRRLFPVSDRTHGKKFYLRRDDVDPSETITGKGAWVLTPLGIALIMVEGADLIFAVDSIPAIFAITADPFLVFTSNVFAILGLRSLYFALAGMIDKFHYLKASLAIILAMVGAKMLIAPWLKETLGKNFNFYVLAAVLFVLAIGVIASMLRRRQLAVLQHASGPDSPGAPDERHSAGADFRHAHPHVR